MGSDRIRAEGKKSSSLIPGYKPKQFSFLQPRYQDQVETESDSLTENKQQNSLEQSNPRLPSVGHSFGRVSVLPIQTKLAIGQPNDKYEQEADRVAAQVVQQVNSPQAQQSGGIQRDAVNLEDDKSLQTKPLISKLQRETVPEEEEDEATLQTKSLLQRQEKPEEEEELQMKPMNTSIQQQDMPEEEEEELQTKPIVQRREGGKTVAPVDLEASIERTQGQGQPLGDKVRGPMEQAFGSDFSRVRVHTDARSDQLNKSIQARAFTTGQDVFFRQGEYQPGSRGGQELLAHELTHVVQQSDRGNSQLKIQRQQKKTAPRKPKPRIIKVYLDGKQHIVVMQGNQTLFNKTASAATKTRTQLLKKTKDHRCQGDWCYARFRIGYQTPGDSLTGRKGLKYFSGVYGNYGIHSNIQRKPKKVRTKKGGVRIIRERKNLLANGKEDPTGSGCVRLSEPDARRFHQIVSEGDEVRYYYRNRKARNKKKKSK